MATASKTKVEKVIHEDAILLTLSPAEARALLSMTNNVRGGETYARLIQPIGDALSKAGVISQLSMTGGTTLTFVPESFERFSQG